MANINMILDSQGTPLDISGDIMQMTAIREAVIYNDGPAGGQSKMGPPIYDRLKNGYRFTVPLKPAPQNVYQAIEEKVAEGPFCVTYTSYRSPTDVTLFGICTLNEAGYVKTIERDGGEQRIYAGPTITFEGYERS